VRIRAQQIVHSNLPLIAQPAGKLLRRKNVEERIVYTSVNGILKLIRITRVDVIDRLLIPMIEAEAHEIRRVNDDLAPDLALDAEIEAVVIRVSQVLIPDDRCCRRAEFRVAAKRLFNRRHQRVYRARKRIGQSRLWHAFEERKREGILAVAGVRRIVVQIEPALEVYRRLDGVARVADAQRCAIVQAVCDADTRQENVLR
jgi:hypothetical protein